MPRAYSQDLRERVIAAVLGGQSRHAAASSITTGAAIATCFAPEENCNAFAVDAVNGADREILVSAYSLTTGSGIPEALARRGAARRQCPPDWRPDHALQP